MTGHGTPPMMPAAVPAPDPAGRPTGPPPPASAGPSPASAGPLPASAGPSPASAGLPPAWAGPSPAALPPRPPGPFSAAVDAFWAERRREVPTSTLVLCVLAGVAGAAALVGPRLGAGAAVVGLLVWLAALPALVRRRAAGDLATATLSVALVGVVAVSDAGWVVALCVGVSAVAAAVAATSARSAPAVLLSGLTWCAGAVRAIPWLGRGAGARLGGRRDELLVALRSVAVTVVLLVAFGLLFASADLVFASYLPDVALDRLPAQIAVGAVVAVAAAACAHLAAAPPGWAGLRLGPARPARRGEWLLPVLALDAMVLAFVLVQVAGLVGGHGHVLETVGLTYAEYARQGFAQLVAVTALTLLVVAVAARRAPRATPADRQVSRAALGLLCVATLGVVVSALRRMDLYVEAFGLTRLRVFVVVLEVVLGVVLVLVIVAGVRWRGGWLPRAVVQVLAVAMLGLAALNPDALIVRHNTTADLDVPLDVRYLMGLSVDAVPAMDRLAEPLRSCLLGRADVGERAGLADWNLARERAATTLAASGVEPAAASAAGSAAGSAACPPVQSPPR